MMMKTLQALRKELRILLSWDQIPSYIPPIQLSDHQVTLCVKSTVNPGFSDLGVQEGLIDSPHEDYDIHKLVRHTHEIDTKFDLVIVVPQPYLLIPLTTLKHLTAQPFYCWLIHIIKIIRLEELLDTQKESSLIILLVYTTGNICIGLEQKGFAI